MERFIKATMLCRPTFATICAGTTAVEVTNELLKILIAGSWNISDGLICCQRLSLFYPDES